MKQLDVEALPDGLSWKVAGTLVVEVEPWVFTMASRSEEVLRIVRAHEDTTGIIRTECDGPCGYFGGRYRTCHHQRLVNAIIQSKMHSNHKE